MMNLKGVVLQERDNEFATFFPYYAISLELAFVAFGMCFVLSEDGMRRVTDTFMKQQLYQEYDWIKTPSEKNLG